MYRSSKDEAQPLFLIVLAHDWTINLCIFTQNDDAYMCMLKISVSSMFDLDDSQTRSVLSALRAFINVSLLPYHFVFMF